MRVASVALAAALGAVAPVAGLFAVDAWLPSDRTLPGSEVLGRVQPRDQPLGAWLDTQAKRHGEAPAYLELPEGVEEVALASLGLEVDPVETTRRSLRHARRGTILERLERALRARKGLEIIDAAFAFREDKARALLQELAPHVRREPTSARLDLRRHRRIPAVPGRELDIETTLERLREAPPVAMTHVKLAFRELAPAEVLEELPAVDVTRVLGSFQTDFTKRAGPRAVNIKNAARLLDRLVLMPGEVLSFNQAVGPRTVQRGFVEAPVIVNDEFESGTGGGVCQVASTLHAAGIYGGLEVLERRSHSRPSGYAPLGLDAVVIDGEIDLKIRNSTAVPLMVHAFLPTRTSIKIEFLGSHPPGEIRHDYAVTERHDFERRVATVSDRALSEPLRRQRGQFGYDVTSVVTTKLPDGTVTRRNYASKYYPVPEVYWIGPDFDPSLLPELPEGASGTEFTTLPSPEDGVSAAATP